MDNTVTDQSTTPPPAENAKLGLLAAVGTALAASICCLGPLLLVSLGATGAWIGQLSALEPYRPFFMALSVGFLGFAFFRVYRTAPQSCEPGSACARPASRRTTKVSLWLVAILVAGLYASPYVIGQRSAEGKAPVTVATETATLTIEGMTCGSCVATVTKSLTRLDGVIDARVTLDPPQAVVEFDPTRVGPQDLVEATSSIGYPSHMAE